MKKIIQDWRERFFDVEKLTLRLVLFNIITLCGMAGGFIALLFTVAVNVEFAQTIEVIIGLVLIAINFYLANWKGMLEKAATNIVGIITLVLFPAMFVTGGGLYSGMGFWFALGILFNFLLIEGARCYVLFILQIVAIVITYEFGYYFPEYIVPLKSDIAVIVDTIQSLVVLATVVGIIVKFQNKIYMETLAKVNRKNEQLKISEENAERANRAKSEFLSNMSHEIRTPINAIIGINQMIVRESDDEKILGYASTVENSAEWLMSIINDILDISKIEEGRIEILKNRYETCSIITESYPMIKKRASDKGLTLDVHINQNLPRKLFGDAMRVRQVLVNLLTNAVKYTESGGIDVYLDGVTINNDFYLKMCVKDTGIGIKEEDLEKMFGKFERFDIARNRAIEGTGLGLNITKKLIELMGGDITVESEYGKGSTFTVMIPNIVVDGKTVGKVDISKLQEKAAKKTYKRKFTAPDAQILIVDDVKINLYVIENLLKDTKIKIDHALSGAECINMMQKKCYDIVFMDHMMPEMDGIETYNAIRNMSLDINNDVPFIMLTANTLSGMNEFYISKGFSDYLTKPIDFEKLEEVVMKYLPKDKLIIEGADKIRKQKKIDGKEQSRMAELHDIVPDVDIKSGLSYCNGNEDFYIELLEDYIKSQRIQEICKAYEDEDWKNYKISVHSLKSISRTLGFNHIGALAEKMQFAAEKVDVEYIRQNHDELVKIFNDTIKQLKRFFE